MEITPKKITVSGGTASSEYAKVGTVITLNASVPSGKSFVKWECTGGVSLKNASSKSTSFVMPNKDVEIKALYKDNLYTLSAKVSGNGGKISADKSIVKYGEKVRITLTPDKGYIVDKVLVNGKSEKVSGNTLSLEIFENTEVSASFKKKPSTPQKPTNPTKPTKPSKPTSPTVKKLSMHRLYNPNSGEHFYTKDTAEKNNLVSLGWKYEGIGWYGVR